jgi:hypothetical protein
MAELKIYLSESLNEKFRRVAMSIYGYGRGSISKAAEAAFTKWCMEHEPPIPVKTADSLENVTGQAGRTDSGIDPDERNKAETELKPRTRQNT